MHFIAVLNRHGGTLRRMDLRRFVRNARAALEAHGHTAEFRIFSGKAIVAGLEEAAAEPRCDVLLVGGGDGTVSAAASLLAGSGKALAVLPAGTMNLFARSLAIPLDPEAAVEAFAAGRVRDVDIASANGRYFVHQYSVGVHSRLVATRSRMRFSSRLGKIAASVRAALLAIRYPAALKVRLVLPDEEITTRTAGIAVSNNLYGDGHLPYADDPAGGELGIYVAKSRSRAGLFFLCMRIAFGRWRESGEVKIRRAQSVRLEIEEAKRARGCVVDGELFPLETDTLIVIHPGALRVLAPPE